MKKHLAASACAIVALVLFSACKTEVKSVGQMPGPVVTETRNLVNFREINAGNAVELEIRARKDFAVSVETNENLLREVFTEVRGDELVISTKDIKSPAGKIKVRISLPQLARLEMWGASTATVTDVASETLAVQVSGSSSLTLGGEAVNLQISAVGASTVNAENLQAEKAEAKANGASNITLYASKELVAETLGASNVFYLGNPKTVKPTIVGSGVVQKK